MRQDYVKSDDVYKNTFFQDLGKNNKKINNRVVRKDSRSVPTRVASQIRK